MFSLRPCDQDGFVTSLINIDFSWLNKQLQKWDFSPLGRPAKQLLVTHCRSRFPLSSQIKKPSGESAVHQPFLTVRPEWSSSSTGGGLQTPVQLAQGQGSLYRVGAGVIPKRPKEALADGGRWASNCI